MRKRGSQAAKAFVADADQLVILKTCGLSPEGFKRRR